MRIALFIDGKNFYSGWKEQSGGCKVDFSLMADWIVDRVEGDHLWGVHYYTGIDPPSEDEGSPQDNLGHFLNALEMLPGFFVNRFPRKRRSITCPDCGETHHFTLEKEVDTTMVADMLRLAAVNAFDVMVLVSGDADHVPAVEGVKTLGKKVYIASWGGFGLSLRLRKAAFDHLDLLQGIPSFAKDPGTGEPAAVPGAASDPCGIFLDELRIAARQFKDGYIGVNYFLNGWRSLRLDSLSVTRASIFEDLLEQESIETYLAEDGYKAVRLIDDAEFEDDEAEEIFEEGDVVEDDDEASVVESPEAVG